MTERASGRSTEALRPVRITRRYLTHAHGSCIIELGETRVLCAATVEEGVSAWRRGQGLGWVTAEYAMLPAATHTRARRESQTGTRGRTQEIQRLVGRSLRAVVDMAAMGEVTCTVDCDVIQADGGTRTAAITGAFIAMSDALARWQAAGKIAASPILGHVAATSVGLVDGVVMLDLDYSEDSVAEVDMNVVMDATGRFIEVQGTGEKTPFDRARLNELLDLSAYGIEQLIAIQNKVLSEDLDVFES